MKKLLYIFLLIGIFACDEVPDINSYVSHDQQIKVDGNDMTVSARVMFSLENHLIITLDQGGSYITLILDKLELNTPIIMKESRNNLVFYGDWSNVNSNLATGEVRVENLEINSIQISGEFILENEFGITKTIELDQITCYFSTGATSYEYNVSIGKGTITNLTTSETEKVYFYVHSENTSSPNSWYLQFFPYTLGSLDYTLMSFHTSDALEQGQDYQLSCNNHYAAFYKGERLYCLDGFELSNVQVKEQGEYKIYDVEFSSTLETWFGLDQYSFDLNIDKYQLIN